MAYIPPDRKRYLTLDAPPEGRFCRVVSLPDDPLWIGLFDGLFSSITEPWAWRKNGDLDEEEMARAWFDIYMAQQDSPVCDLRELARPYWDDQDADDAGNSESDGFPWYENASDWLVGAFLASAGLGGAAFEFVTIARRFRLYFRTRNYGGIVRILLGGEEVGVVDTYSADPGQTFVDIFTPDAAGGFTAFDVDTYTLRIEHTGEHNPDATPNGAGQYPIDVIRKRLWEGELGRTDQRYSSDCDCVETLNDAGDWIETPGADPRHSLGNLLPPVVADDQRCQAALNMVAFINEVIDQVVALIEAGSAVTTVVTLLALLFLPLGIWAVLIEILAALAALMFSTGAVLLNTAFGSATYDLLKCILYCNIGEDGQVSPEQFATIKAEYAGQLNPIASTILDAMFFLMGEVGLSNAGTMGDASGDCDDCDCEEHWCIEYDFTLDPYSFTTLLGQARGEWVEGVGWIAVPFDVYVLLQIQRDFSAYMIDAVTIDYDWTPGSGGRCAVEWDGVEVQGTTTGGATHVAFSTVEGAMLFLNLIASTSGGGGSVTAQRVIIQGHGEPKPTDGVERFDC